MFASGTTCWQCRALVSSGFLPPSFQVFIMVHACYSGLGIVICLEQSLFFLLLSQADIDAGSVSFEAAAVRFVFCTLQALMRVLTAQTGAGFAGADANMDIAVSKGSKPGTSQARDHTSNSQLPSNLRCPKSHQVEAIGTQTVV